MLKNDIDKYGESVYDSPLRHERMKELREILTNKEAQLSKLQHDIEILRTAIGLVEREQKVTQKIEERSVPQLAAAILEEAGKPLHTHEIRMGILFSGRQISKESLSSALFQYSKRKKTFYKVSDKPNTYGLRRWHESDIDQEIMNIQ